MVFDVLRTLGRRWYVVLVGLLLTAGMVFGASAASPPKYDARALVLLLPSKADVGRGGNPLLQLSGLEQPASILAAYFSSAPARDDVAQLSSTAEYEVAIDSSTRGPVLSVDVSDETAEDTMKVLAYLLDRIPEELTRLQEDVDARRNAFVGSMVLTMDREPEVSLSGTIRLMIAALAVGLVGTGFGAVALDGFLRRRRRRMELTSDVGEGTDGEGDEQTSADGSTGLGSAGAADGDRPTRRRGRSGSVAASPAQPADPVEPVDSTEAEQRSVPVGGARKDS